MKKLKRLYADTQLQKGYEAGYDAGINGGNRENSDYSFFTSPGRNASWTHGYRNAITE